MRVSTLVALAIAIGVGLALATGFPPTAEAQYPPPTGSVVLSAGDTTPDLGEDVPILATILDEAGSPVAGLSCTFHVAQQPGDDATVDPGPATTDAEGTASTTLNTGTSEGTIIVGATCEDLTAEVTVVAGEVAPPPASLPETGTGMEDGGSGWSFGAIAIALAVVGLIVATLVRRRARA